MGDQIFCFFSDSNTDSEFEKIMNLLFLYSYSFTVAHLLIFFSPSGNFHSIVWIYFNLQHIMRSSTYSDQSISGGNSLVILFIFILTGRLL